MPKDKPSKSAQRFFEDAVAAWLKYDPFVRLAVKNDDRVRRDVLLNLIGPQATMRHFTMFPPAKTGDGPIFPQTVREEVDRCIMDPRKRTQLVKKLVFWATDININSRYIRSHETRFQIVTSLLGEIFFNATPLQEDMILKGVKYLIAEKPTALNAMGEQSLEVHKAIIGRIRDILVYNQRVIIEKAVSEAQEHMRVHLIRQIHEMRGKSAAAIFEGTEKTYLRRKLLQEKFPLRPEIQRQFEEILDFYREVKGENLRHLAQEAKENLQEVRHPLTLTQEKDAR